MIHLWTKRKPSTVRAGNLDLFLVQPPLPGPSGGKVILSSNSESIWNIIRIVYFQTMMIESLDPVTMRICFYRTHTLWSSRVWALPTCLSQRWGGWSRAGRHIARHPPLMDRGHYGSWGQVPLTIKGPSQWLGKNGSGEWEEEGKGSCCRRTSKHKRFRRKHTWNEWQVGGEGEGDRWRELYIGWEILSVIQYDILRTKTVITRANMPANRCRSTFLFFKCSFTNRNLSSLPSLSENLATVWLRSIVLCSWPLFLDL